MPSPVATLGLVVRRAFARALRAGGLVLLSWAFVAACCVSIASADELPEVIPAEGPPFGGRWTGVEKPWKLRFELASGTRELAASELVRYGQFVDAVRGPQVLLAGGGLIVGDVRQIDREQLALEADLLGSLKLPLDGVQAVLFHPPNDRQRRDQLVRRLRFAKGDTDSVLLENGDELTGTLTALDEKVLGLETPTGKLDVDLPRITAVVFNPALARKARLSGLRAMLGFKDGSRVLAVAVEQAGRQVRLTLPGGTSATTNWGSIVGLEPFGGRAVYLSDLKPAGYKQIPFLQLAWPYENDRNVAGELLRAGGKLFLKGLGLHSAARLTYDLDRTYQRLEGLLAIDDATAGRGSVTFRVYVDAGDGRWEPRFSSPVVRGGEPPQPFTVELAGVKRISLLVEYADRGDELDYADWLEVRLIK